MSTIADKLICSTKALALAASIGVALAMTPTAALSSGQPAALQAFAATTSPIGWVQFCRDNAAECALKNTGASEVKLSQKLWADMVRINKKYNDEIEPLSDMDHYGVVEYWNYPTDGKGDCEDYVLLKRRALIEAGFPRAALLITVVRQQNGEGHAVLTVKTDRGDYVLDNQADEILLWHSTGYRFVKRQSANDQSQWVSLTPPTGQAVASRQ